MTRLALRDHAQQILEAVAADLRTPQTPREQSEKSKGHAPVIAGAPETAAQTHAVLRAGSGFHINHLVAEYRALRATVLRRWIAAGAAEPRHVEDMLRFNEAIDQAIAESVVHFDAQVERARNLLLGMLGHDMQSPLSSILVTAKYLSRLHAGDQVSSAAGMLIRSGASMQALLDDLVDFNRTRLGLGLPVTRFRVDLGLVVEDELEQLRAIHPGRRIEVACSGELRGSWDGIRVQQVLRNLVSNALRYGSKDAPVRVVVRGAERDVFLEVVNRGERLEQAAIDELFEPLKRGVAQHDHPEDRPGLGLGLFIVREIARAHGGEATGRSSGGDTTFTVRLPRVDAAAAQGTRSHDADSLAKQSSP